MAVGAVPSAQGPQHDVRWKWLLLGLCGLAGILLASVIADEFGVGGRPWFGTWEMSSATTDHAYVVAVIQPVPGGPSARSGLHDGDRIDLRDQSLEARVRLIFEPLATRALTLRVHRGAKSLRLAVVGGTLWERDVGSYFIEEIIPFLSAAWFLACATLIAACRWWLYEARVLALVMLCQVAYLLGPAYLVVPGAQLQLMLAAVSSALVLTAAILLVVLSSRYGTRVAWRRPLELFAYVTNAALFVMLIAAFVDIAMLWIDPLPVLSLQGWFSGFNPAFWLLANASAPLAVVVCAVAAVIASPKIERSRTAWILLPLPLAIGGLGILDSLSGSVPSYSFAIALQVMSAFCWLLGGLLVTYALLNRRVLDVSFVLNRTIVVAIVSLIVVAAFVLLEWLLGTVLAGVSHATGLIANGALALIIGVSLGYIQKAVDRFVDATLFRKRHEDERALLDFSKEAAYVTNSESLLDAAIGQIERHTDSRNARILLDRHGSYATVRSFRDGVPLAVDENDGAILALKAWHKPLDPHHYSTGLQGALAVPMVGRGRLLGVLLLGERAGGEAYAPDEVEALSQFAHGLGSGIDALSATQNDSIAELRASIASMVDGMTDGMASLGQAMRELQRSIAPELRDGR